MLRKVFMVRILMDLPIRILIILEGTQRWSSYPGMQFTMHIALIIMNIWWIC